VSGIGAWVKALGLPAYLAWGLVAVAILLALVRRYSKRLPTVETWTFYLKGQGALLFVFLLLGGAVAWLGSQGPPKASVREHGKLVEFRQLDPSQEPIFEDVDVENFEEITVITKTTAPPNGSATVTLFPESSGAANGQSQRIESHPGDWSRWDQQNSGKRLSFMVAPSARPGSVPANQMDVLIYLTPQHQPSDPNF
jgi:hypothetical protein